VNRLVVGLLAGALGGVAGAWLARRVPRREGPGGPALLRAEVGAALAHPGTLQEMLPPCAEAMVRHLRGAFARIWVLPPDTQVLELRASAGRYTHLDGEHARIPLGHLKIGQIAQQGTPLLTNDVTNDPRIQDKQWALREGLVAFTGYPLLADGHVVGVMAMFARHRLEEDTLEALASVADAMAQGIARKYAEERLRQSEERFRLLLDSTGEAIYGMDLEGRCTFANRTCARLLGYPDASVLIGRQMHDTIHHTHQDGRPYPRAECVVYEATTRQGIHEDKEWLWRADGTGFPAEVWSYPIWRGNERLGAVVTFVDITERHEAEAERARDAVPSRGGQPGAPASPGTSRAIAAHPRAGPTARAAKAHPHPARSASHGTRWMAGRVSAKPRQVCTVSIVPARPGGACSATLAENWAESATTATPHTRQSATVAAGACPKANPASRQHAPLAAMAQMVSRALPIRSARRPPAMQPNAPAPITAKAASAARPGSSAQPAAAKLAAR